MFLLDTNVLSELRRAHRADARVRQWSQGFSSQQFFLSAVTVLEIEQGILQVGRRDTAQAALFDDWLRNFVLIEFAARILPFDTAVALRCAALHVPDPKPERDSIIAATGLVHGMTVITRNISDFAGCGVPTFDPWAFQG